MPVPMDTDGTYTIKQLVEEAHQYEYSTSIPLKIYLTTADRLRANANLFKEQQHYADAYRLYIRFLDLLTNKIATHPQLTKRNPLEHKKYLNLVKEAASVFQSAEEVKLILTEKIERHERLRRKLAEQRAKEAHDKLMKAAEEMKRQQEKAKEREQKQRRLSDNESDISDISTSTSDLFIDSDADEAPHKIQGARRKFSDSLFRHNASHSHSNLEKIESYPTIPKFPLHGHKSNNTKDNEEIGGTPPLPPPKEPPVQTKTDASQQKTPPMAFVVPAAPNSTHSSPEIQHSSPVQLQKIPVSSTIQHKPIAVNEAGKSLKKVFVPLELKSQFLDIANSNTKRKLETCGILCGKLSLNAFFVTTLLIPKQESTENTCQTIDEELMFDYIDKNDLFVLGWIHTHPTQTCFLSSVDLHTQNAYQLMLPEAVAIVCAPSVRPEVGAGDFGVFRLTDPPGVGVITKCQRSGFHPHNEGNLYKSCERRSKGHVVFESGLPFLTHDLR